MISPALDDALARAAEHGASDLILREGKPPVARINGALFALETAPPVADDMDALWSACGAGPGETDHDASLAAGGGERFRVNLHRRLGERGAVLRRIKREIPGLDTLGVPADLLREWGARESGLLVVSGPTGSGKSTTLAALLDYINKTAARHVVTIEDPVEYLFEPALCVFTQREVGVDTPSFAEGLRRSLRQDPDIILVGEIRDAARKTLSGLLLGVLCQRLVPARAGGRVAACEYFTNEALSRRLIAEGRLPELQDLIARGDPRTARPLQESLLQLVRKGTVDETVAMEIVARPQDFARALKGIASGATATRR